MGKTDQEEEMTKEMKTTEQAAAFIEKTVPTVRYHTRITKKLKPTRDYKGDFLYPVEQLIRLKRELSEEPAEDEYFLKEAAAYLNRAPQTLRTHLDLGHIRPARRIGNKLVFSREALDQLKADLRNLRTDSDNL
jgi:hypothetical protein